MSSWLPRFFPPDRAGNAFAPARERYVFSAAVFLRLLAVTHAIAFVSLWVQLPGLIGPHGILPAGAYLRAVHDYLGADAYARLPTLGWIFGADTFLTVLCAVGVGAAALLFAGIAPTACLIVLWVCYLSLVNVGQAFLGFQWDALLLETTLLTIFLPRLTWRPRFHFGEPSGIARWLLRWLLFRLMLLSGIVKLSSGDPTWRNLTALDFHFETQPLPNPLAWWAHHASENVHRAACAGMFAIELIAPFFLFAPRPLRHNAALLLLALQLAIALTGNFAFFNLLTAALCLLNLDDAFWLRLLRGDPGKCHTLYDTLIGRSARGVAVSVSGWTLAGCVVVYTAVAAWPSVRPGAKRPGWFESVATWVAPFNSFNNYGLFAVMTTSRPELSLEGSNDQREWLAYELPYKPGALSRPLPVVAPHQPRLDWQLWFAALGAPQQNPWVLSLAEHLLRGTPEVLALFAHNPFPGQPPRFLRVVRYDYRFASPAERARTGRFWERTPIDYYLAPAALK
ncbi:MAG TPA: lipase maturation factor family protein [Opitutus sp.]|nr:lipase maturation factor family protein [Opitutus sp.]